MAAVNQVFPGILASPEYAGNVYDVQTKQALAQALLQKGLQGNLAAYQPAGGGFAYVPKMGIGGALAGSVLPGLLGSALQRQANQELTALGRQQQAALTRMLTPQTVTETIGGGGAPGMVPAVVAGQPGVAGQPDAQALGAALAPQTVTRTTAAPLNPGNLDPNVALYLLNTAPEKYLENVLSYNKPAEVISQLRAAGIDPNSALGRQIGQQALAKATYQAPFVSKAGDIISDPNDVNRVLRVNPNIGEGMEVVTRSDGSKMVVPIQGYTGTIGAIEGARAQARATGEESKIYNPETKRYEIAPRSVAIAGPGSAGGGLGTGRLGGAPGAAPGGRFAAGPALGAEQAEGVEGTEQAKRGIELDREAGAAPQQRLFIRELRQTMSGFDPGNPKADWALTMKKMVNTANPFGNTFDPHKIASQEQFNKAANQLAMAQFKDLGSGGAQSTLETAMKSNPNATISRLGNKGILDLLQGNVDAKERMGAEWQRWKESNGPGSYSKFQTEWGKSYDPQVFMIPYQSKAEAAAMVNSMSPQERKVFQQKFNFAVQNGWIQLPE